MKINTAKTQLLCISGANFCDTESFIDTEGGEHIRSQESLTILGFCFGRRPDATAHFGLLKNKYAKKAWIIRQLKLQGVDEGTLTKVYAAIIRSMIEYASPAYHLLLSAHLGDQIEKFQRMMLKTIYGSDVSYARPWRNPD